MPFTPIFIIHSLKRYFHSFFMDYFVNIGYNIITVKITKGVEKNGRSNYIRPLGLDKEWRQRRQ